MVATIALDLTQAIIVGLVVSLAIFLSQIARLTINTAPVNWELVGTKPRVDPDVQVIYVSGPLFFASVNQFVERIEEMPFARNLILSMRGVPMTDVSSVQAIEHLWQAHVQQHGTLYVTGLQPSVRRTFERAGLVAAMGEDQFLWSADHAIRRVVERVGTTASSSAAAPDGADAFDEIPLGVVTVG
ncbi:MAG: STAS domain-containing protein [Thermomicrobiales bacterium]